MNEIKETPDIYPNLLDPKKTFLFVLKYMCVCVFSLSVVFDSLQPHGL